MNKLTRFMAARSKASVPRWVLGPVMLAILCSGPLSAEAQRPWNGGWGGGWRRYPPKGPDREIFPGNSFTFCRVFYESIRSEPLGHGWNTDYPDSDLNFSIRLSELTTIVVNRQENGEPAHVVLRLTEPDLFNYPYIFMSDVGTVGFTEEEIVSLRAYLMKGGFLHVDDFWGTRAWEHWSNQIGMVLSPDEYPIEDIPMTDEIYNIVFRIKELKQVPSIQHWYRSGGATSEQGSDSAVPHFRGIRDEDGRLIVVMTHNTDLADGWEREAENREFFEEFSVKISYPLGINIVVYAMTH